MAGKLTGLHAKLTGDSTSFVRATTLAAMALRKQEEQAKKAKQAQDALAASGVGLSKEFHRLKMETDNAYAGMVRYNNAAEVARKVAVQQKWSQEQLGTELQRLAVHYGVAEQAGFNMSEQVRAGRFHTANLAAQFNDIGVMMASGQSPFIMAIQQGTQVSQVLNDMGGGAKATGKALLTAFTSIISPVSLITIGLMRRPVPGKRHSVLIRPLTHWVTLSPFTPVTRKRPRKIRKHSLRNSAATRWRCRTFHSG